MRNQLLHARACLPKAVHFALWLYALCNTALLHNSLSVLEDGTSRLEHFSSIHVGSNMRHVHSFGCPVFALQNALASGNQLPCWSPRMHHGLNLGPSPMHARNVYLVLNIITGCVSPQYHCCFNNFFKTMLCFWHHLMATINELGLCNHDFFRGVSTNTLQCYVPRDTIWRRYSYYEQTPLCAAYVWCHIG
jgi:hypothetical protein